MRKILFVTGGLGRGGAQRVLTLLANEYVKAGWSVHIATLLNSEAGYNLNEDILIHDLSKKGNYLKNVIYWIKSLRKVFLEEKPDVVLSFVGRINVISMIANKQLNIPMIVSERNDPNFDRRSKFEMFLCKYYYRKANCVIFQTKYQQNYYKNYCKSNSVIIGNPIAADSYADEHISKDIVSVGKLMTQKNHPMLIKAFAMIADKYPEKKVHIFGDGELNEELHNLIDSLNMKDRIILEGNSSCIFEELHKHQYFVMTSNYEGLSNALLEAMISGMVCISTSWGGVEEVISNGYNGYLVPINDYKELANVLEEVFLNDQNSVTKMGVKTALDYRTDNIIGKWFEIVEKVRSNK